MAGDGHKVPEGGQDFDPDPGGEAADTVAAALGCVVMATIRRVAGVLPHEDPAVPTHENLAGCAAGHHGRVSVGPTAEDSLGDAPPARTVVIVQPQWVHADSAAGSVASVTAEIQN